MFFIFVYAAVLELNETSFKNTVAQFPFLLVEFYSQQCPACQAFAPEYERASKLLNEPNIRFARVEVHSSPKIAKALNIKRLPELVFYRLAAQEPYDGPRDALGITKWVIKNARQLIRPFQFAEDLEAFLRNRIALVYFHKYGLEPDHRILQQMKIIGKKYQQIHMVEVVQPDLRKKFNVPSSLELLLYPQEGDPVSFEGVIIEYCIMSSLWIRAVHHIEGIPISVQWDGARSRNTRERSADQGGDAGQGEGEVGRPCEGV